jgi:hypothetical protein
MIALLGPNSAGVRRFKKCDAVAWRHVQRTYGPDNSLITNAPRVPFLVISPCGKTHYISHHQGSQSCVVKFVDTVFRLPAQLVACLDSDGLPPRQSESFASQMQGVQSIIRVIMVEPLDITPGNRLCLVLRESGGAAVYRWYGTQRIPAFAGMT